MKKRKKRSEWTNEDWRHEAVEIAKKIAKHLGYYKCCNEGCINSADIGKQMHGSHILPEGNFHRMSVVLDNIMCQCAYHHMQWHEHPLAQHEWFHKQFPGKYERLKKMDEEFKKEYIKPDYKKICEELQEQLNAIING